MAETNMRREILEIPQAVERLLRHGSDAIVRAADELRAANPRFVVSVARGSSDHAALYLKYACELLLGLPVASLGPSVVSIYGRLLKLNGAACIAVSQSGKSPDICSMAKSAADQNALTIAITNEPASPLANICRHTLHIHAGPEYSVAATKTFVTSAVAGLKLLAHWAQDKPLIDTIEALPQRLEKAAKIEWPALTQALENRSSLYVIGRGPAVAMANEMALKFKETSQIHAESYSSAEVLHGPVSIVGEDYPVLALACADAAESSLVTVADNLALNGAQVMVTSELAQQAEILPCIRTGHSLTDPLSLIVTFYAFVEEFARLRGLEPDSPRNLRKVTETV